MRRLVKSAILLVLLWSLLWYAAGFGLRRGIEGWFAAQRARGWQADYADVWTSGYPIRHIHRIEQPALADPATGAAWRADWLMLTSPAVWPGHQTVRFPASEQRLSYFDQTSVLIAQDMVARMNLRLGRALELERLELTTGEWALQGRDDRLAEADGLTLSMRQSDQPDTYHLLASAPDFAPGAALRLAAQLPRNLPAGFDVLDVEMTVRFDRPWDRRALEDRRPQPRAVTLDRAEARWGNLRLRASGTLEIDAEGLPTGDLMLRAENWNQMLRMATATGLLPPEAEAPLLRVLSMLAGGETLPLYTPLHFANGVMKLGPLPIGPAPRLLLR